MKTQRLHMWVRSVLTNPCDQLEGQRQCCIPHLTPILRSKRRLRCGRSHQNVAMRGLRCWNATSSSDDIWSCVKHMGGQLQIWRGPGERYENFWAREVDSCISYHHRSLMILIKGNLMSQRCLVTVFDPDVDPLCATPSRSDDIPERLCASSCKKTQ